MTKRVRPKPKQNEAGRANRGAKKQDHHSLPFGPPLLLDHEDEDAYDALYAQLRIAVDPSDMLEEMLVRDIADLCWQILRFRKILANLMNASASLSMALDDQEDDEEEDDDEEDNDDEDDDDEDDEDVLAADRGARQTLPAEIDLINQIDQMVARAEARRNSIVREIDRHRSARGNAVRHPATQIEGSDCHAVGESGRRRLS